MNPTLDRLRAIWDELNDREQLMVVVLGAVAAFCILAFPLFWTARQNAEIEDQNAQLRSALELIGQHRADLQQLTEERKQALLRYTHHTPPLGTFLEGEAKKHNLTIREVTDQPEKATGNYHRRSVRASINDVGLTGIIDLLSGIVTSQNPVAVDQIQIEHYQAGDTYKFKLGVLTFDKKEGKSQPEGPKTRRVGPSPSDG
jgi:type II secretory pathway component PulM